eukprot:gene11226-18963_t
MAFGALTMNRMICFGTDFFATRRFAYGMHAREQELEASIRAAEEVGDALAAYDTAAARALVGSDEGTAMPPRLRDAL